MNWFHRSRVLRPILLGLVAAVVAAALAPLFTPARGPVVVLPGLIAGAVVALTDVLAASSARDNAARAREALGFELTPQLRRRALRGEIPLDPAVREQHRHVVEYLADRVRSGLRRSSIFAAVNVVLQVGLALLVSAFFWGLVALTVSGQLVLLWEHRRLRRRRALLGSAPYGAAAGDEPQPLPRA